MIIGGIYGLSHNIADLSCEESMSIARKSRPTGRYTARAIHDDAEGSSKLSASGFGVRGMRGSNDVLIVPVR